MTAYYNDNDPFVCQWLKNLIKEGFIPDGTVECKSIADIAPGDLEGYSQCHFFAGIGGWAYALRLANWPDKLRVWTGSCPCQPFSVAGKGGGIGDERHLWPAFRWLIAQCRPAIVFGEQVASADGREWLSGLRTDLEVMGYEVGGADLCAAGVGAPHIRQRLWWVANTSVSPYERKKPQPNKWNIPETDGKTISGRLGDAEGEQMGRTGQPWADFLALSCRDGKLRRIPSQPALFPLAPRLPGRVGVLRGAGNSIVPQVAAEFIRAYMEAK